MNRKRKDENGQKQKRKNIGIIVAALLVVYVLFMVLLLILFGSSSGNQAKSKTVKKETETQTQKSERKHVSTSKEELQDNTVTYDDGDYVYTPSDDHIFFDDTDHMIYYDNLITVYLDRKISNQEKEKIKKKIDGESIGSDLSGTLNVLDIVVASSDYAKLQQKAEEAAKLDGAQYAMISFPVENQIFILPVFVFKTKGAVFLLLQLHDPLFACDLCSVLYILDLFAHDRI